MKVLRLFITVISSAILLLLVLGALSAIFSTIVSAGDFYGVGSVVATLDTDKDTVLGDFSTRVNYLAIGNTSKNFEIYGVHRALVDTTYIEEAYVKFPMFGLDTNIGKIVQPFGLTYFSRPQNSVFMSIPRFDIPDDSILLTFDSDIIDVAASYAGNDVTTARVKGTFFNELLVPSVSYTNNEEIKKELGKWIIAGESYFQSTYLNYSLLGEWMVDNQNYWVRTVLTPGFFDIIGLLAAYYHTPDMAFTLEAWEVSRDNVFTYGAFTDIADNLTLTIEWRADRPLSPFTFRFITTF
jgi:hypothetical protein